MKILSMPTVFTEKLKPLHYWDISHNGWPSYTSRYYNEANALQLFEESDKTRFTISSGTDITGFSLDCGDYPPSFKPHHEELCFVGNVVSHRGKTITRKYYTTEENLAAMKIIVANMQSRAKKHDDAYYSRPWV